MRICVIIPARLESKRLPRKPLIDLKGKPMIYHVYEKAVASGVGDVYVATDSKEIESVLSGMGVPVIMTGKASSGTERVYLASHLIDGDIFINLQGDEPLINPESLKILKDGFLKDMPDVGTLAVEKEDKDEFLDPNVVKVVTDRNGYALYFSRSPIPYGSNVFLKHIGVYMYTREFLRIFSNLEQAPMEHSEKLEQLKVLFHGYKIKVYKTPYDSIGVDTRDDLERVKRIIGG